MASRSTRRRLKSSEMPKLEECQNEDESPEDKQSGVARRRSLRHSPGSSSVSPPRKTRRIKDSPSAVENKTIKATVNKNPKSSVKSPSQGIKVLKDEESNEDIPDEIVTPKKNTRNSPVTLNSTPIRMTRNSSVSPYSPSRRSAPNKLIPSNRNESASPSSRRNTRSKAHSPCDKDTENEITLKDDSINKSRKGYLSNSSPVQGKGIAEVPSTSQGRKRSLPHSPELPVTEETNDTTFKQTPFRSSKRKCQSPGIETQPTTNGKSHDDNLGNFKEKKLKTDKDSIESDVTSNSLVNNCSSSLSPASADVNSIQSNGESSGKNVKMSPNKLSKVDDVKVSNKRRLNNDSPELSESSNKKYKCDQISEFSIDSPKSLPCVKKESNAQQIVISNNSELPKSSTGTEATSLILSENMDTSTNAELLLIKDFALTESQCKEVCSVLSSDIKESSYVVIVEELVRKLLTESTSIPSMSSPRFNKLLRQLLIKYCSSDTSIEKKHLLCESALEWSKERKSVNLRHELELALMTLYYNTGFYRKAEETAAGLYKETKKLQDKEKTVKACLCLSKAYHAMGNISKARANITTAKTEALKIYTPPNLQGELDLQSGIMQVAEEKDMETAFSYFKEAATGFSVRANRSKALKYMLLTKLLVNRPGEGEKAVRSQSHVEDIDGGVEAMLSITKAAVSCSLADFKKAREQYGKELEEDLVVRGVLDQLYSKMLEKNLLNIIAPYEKMQISVVAEKIGLGREEVERRLSQMILDGEISAQLDHRDDCLYVYPPEEKDSVYEHALESVSQFDRTLSLLNRRVKQLL